MKEVNLFDDGLKQLFKKGDPFMFAQNIEGKIFRKYQNRVTKKIQIEEKSYFIKFHGSTGWKEIFKNLIQVKTPVIGAQREYDAITHLSKRNINCPEVKGFGNQGWNPARSSSFLITEELYQTISLEDFFLQGLHKKLSFKQKSKLIQSSASLIRKMHLSGLNHRDLYLCHLHIKEEINFDDIEMHLIDLHRAQIRSKVPKRWIVKDIGGFIHSVLQFNLTERDFYRFMMTYFDCSLKDLIFVKQDIIKQILNRAFSMYLKPALKEFSYKTSLLASKEVLFSKHKVKPGKFFIKKNIDPDLFMKLFKNEELLKDSGEIIKNELGHLIVKVKIHNTNFYIKKYRIKNLFHGLSRILKKTRAYNSWIAIQWMNAVGIKTVNPVSFYEEQGFFGYRTSFLVTEEIEGKRLDEALESDVDGDLLVSRIEALFKRMNWIKFSHGDAKSSNFFYDKERLVIFDLDSSRKRYTNFLYRRAVLRDKKRIMKSLQDHKEVSLKLSNRLQGN